MDRQFVFTAAGALISGFVICLLVANHERGDNPWFIQRAMLKLAAFCGITALLLCIYLIVSYVWRCNR